MNEHQLNQHELRVPEDMKVNRAEELDTYLGELSQQEQDTRREVIDDSVQPSNEGESSYQQPTYDWGASSSSHRPNYNHSYNDPPAWNPYPRWG